MMSGFVTPDRTAVMPLVLKGANGLEFGLQMTVDTGFGEELSLSQDWIDAMALPFVRFNDIILSDGSVIQVSIYKGTVVWNGQDKAVEIHCLDSDPLIGMSLLLNFLLTLPVRAGETFTMVPMP